jgi:RNA recognition motif-containing protein
LVRATYDFDPFQTLLFVANLPFSVDDAALTEAFTSLSITPKSSKIITKPSYHYVDGKRERGPRRSKGFAFVEVENEEAQQQAIEKLQGFKMGDREITIKVANERIQQADEHGDEEALKEEGAKEAVAEEQKQESA